MPRLRHRGAGPRPEKPAAEFVACPACGGLAMLVRPASPDMQGRHSAATLAAAACIDYARIMSTQDESPAVGRFTGVAKAWQWLALSAASLLLTVALEALQLPAALLIGPMIAAIAMGIEGARIRVAAPCYFAAQALVGILVAGGIEIGIVAVFVDEWPIVLLAVLSTLAASSVLGWMISRFSILPGTTGLWGSTPGGATAMVLMAGAFGADTRLVAFMQYLRVIMVTVVAAVIARLFVDGPLPAAAVPNLIPDDWGAVGLTLLAAAAGAGLGRLLRVPSAAFLGAFAFGTAMHLAGLLAVEVPEVLLAVAYVAIGWSIGLNFDRKVLRHALRALPAILASILILIGLCGGLAWLLAHELGIDPLTAYLATSPGGMDSIAIIAAASRNVDVSLVMALQTARLVVVIVAGPPLARLIAHSLR